MTATNTILAKNVPCIQIVTDTGNHIVENVITIEIRHVSPEDFDEYTMGLYDPDSLYYVVTYENSNGIHTILNKVANSRIRPYGDSYGFNFSGFDNIAKENYKRYNEDCIRDEEAHKAEELRVLKEAAKPRYFKRTKNGVLDGVASAYTEEYIEKLRKNGYHEIGRSNYKHIMDKGNLAISYNYE